jgi:hypothetical protein
VAPKKNYSRYFIILQEDEKGYALDTGKTPSGYVKLEKKNGKCKISYYVQNLNKKMQPYYMILVCGKKDVKKIIKVGKINIDDYGRVDICNEYDLNNIANSGYGMDKIIGAAIVKLIDTNIISIMSGFSTSDIPKDWRNYSIVNDDRKDENVKQEQENIFDKYEKTIEKVEMDDKAEEIKDEVIKGDIDNKIRGDKKEVVEVQDEIQDESKEQMEEDVGDEEKVREELRNELREQLKNEMKEQVRNEVREEVKDEIKEEVKKEMEEELNKDDLLEEIKGQKENFRKNKSVELNDNIEKTKKNEMYEQEYSDNYPRGVMGDFFRELVCDFDEVDNIVRDIKHCKWYKIPIKNIEAMYDTSEHDKYALIYYPMLCYYSYIQKHAYYNLGYKCDNKGRLKYLIYAIPGSKSKADQPFEGKTGFVTWVSCIGKKDMGYWLMFYDIENSTVVIPMKK